MKLKQIMIPVIIALAAGLLMTTACKNDDVARVTIQLQAPGQACAPAPKSWIEKIMRFFTSDAYATSAFPVWSKQVGTIQITIEAPDIAPINIEVPPYTQTFSTMVPSGDARIFTVYGINTDGGLDTGLNPQAPQGKTWSYSAITNLDAGDDIILLIFMIPMPAYITVSGSATATIDWTYPNDTNVKGYNLYRAPTILGPYVKINTITPYTASSINDNSPLTGKNYYKITSYSNFGESALSDPIVFR